MGDEMLEVASYETMKLNISTIFAHVFLVLRILCKLCYSNTAVACELTLPGS